MAESEIIHADARARSATRTSRLTTRFPAVTGGRPAFPTELPFVRPSLPSLERVARRLGPSYDRGILTNGPLVRELETRVAERLGVDHVVGVASCTSGLMLALRAVAPRGDVIVPSFTFCATAHAVMWNGLRPRFVDCDASTYNVDVADVARELRGAGGILATHIFGTPCRVEALEALAANANIPLIFDAAHGFGALRRGRPIGTFGDAEVFSLTPTKPLVAGEGGLVATNRAELAEAVRLGRDYGNPGDYDTRFVGLNARMSELHAALAIESLVQFDRDLDHRNQLAATYRAGLSTVPGLKPQVIDPEDRSTFKDFGFVVDRHRFGTTRDNLYVALRLEGIDTRRYFSPPVHRQQAYATIETAELPVTDDIAESVLNVPIFPGMTVQTVERVVAAIAKIHEHVAEVEAALTIGSSTTRAPLAAIAVATETPQPLVDGEIVTAPVW